jgi:Fe-S-cluster containining protein
MAASELIGPADDPCARHGCHLCCLDTRMTLTEGDVARLEAAGFKDFFRLNTEGDLELRNHGGRCVLLDGGRCSAYAARPEGCRLYPLILDLQSDRVVRDEYCPHRGSFPITTGEAERLRRSVAVERIEAERRQWGTDD